MMGITLHMHLRNEHGGGVGGSRLRGEEKLGPGGI